MRMVLFALLAFGAAFVSAFTPAKTVAWNGYPGAVTFTFDDGLESQITTLKPIIDELGIKVTFFATSAFYFGSNSAPFVALAQAGNEIGNHTTTHANLSSVTDDATLTSEITAHAQKLRALDASMEATTFATPYCVASSQAYQKINENHFMSRNCGGSGLFSWGTEPNWMQMDSHYWQSSSTVSDFTNSLTQAAAGKWYVQLNHGVGGDWDIISGNDIKTLMQAAKDKNLWIDTYQRIGAYYRASFTMDKAEAVTTDDGYTLSWTSPHAHFPKSVKLRINLDVSSIDGDVVVSQNGVEISPELDGTYIIEFMDLNLSVQKKAITSLASKKVNLNFKVRAEKNEFLVDGLSSGNYTYRISDVRGKVLAQGALTTGNEARIARPAYNGVVLVSVIPESSAQKETTVMLPSL